MSPRPLREAAREALSFYDGLDRPHEDGEARILDHLQAALAYEAAKPVVEGALTELAAQQTPLGREFEQVWDANAATLYESTPSPIAPMSTSWEMVERIRSIVHRLEIAGKETSPGTVQQTMREAASRLEALEALVAEKEGEIARLRQIAGQKHDEVNLYVNGLVDWRARALTAEAALAKDASPTPPVGG